MPDTVWASVPPRPSPFPQRRSADIRLAAASAARARHLESLRVRAALSTAHAQQVAARERARRAAHTAARHAALIARLATAQSRRLAAQTTRVRRTTSRVRLRAVRAARAAREHTAAAARLRLDRQLQSAAERRAGLVVQRATRAARPSPSRTSTPPCSSDAGVPSLRHAAAALSCNRHERAMAVVGRIERAYLLLRARRALRQAGIDRRAVCGMEFAAMAAAVTKRSALVAAARFLRAADVRPTHAAVRELLASIVVAFHSGVAGNHAVVVPLARRMTTCVYCGNASMLADTWYKWQNAFRVWRKKDRQQLVHALAQDAVAVQSVSELGGTRWKEMLQTHQRRLRTLAGAIGCTDQMDHALRRVRAERDDTLVHEMLIDLPGFLRRVAIADEPPGDTWELLSHELHHHSTNSTVLRGVVDGMERALNGMAPGSFVVPKLADTEDDELAFAQQLLSHTCAALRMSQAPDADSSLAEWEAEAGNRVANGDFSSVLRELSTLVHNTAAAVRVIRMRDVAPVVTQHGHVWERGRFERKIANGVIDSHMPHTHKFLVDGAPLARTLEHADHPLPKVQRMLRAATAHLVAGNGQSAIVPEILALDAGRIAFMQQVARTSAALAGVNAALRGLGVTQPDLKSVRDAADGQFVREAAAQVSEHSREFAERVLSRAVNEAGNVLLRRIEAAIVCQHVPQSLQCVEEQVLELRQGVAAVADVAVRVHGERVENIVQDAIRYDTEEEK